MHSLHFQFFVIATMEAAEVGKGQTQVGQAALKVIFSKMKEEARENSDVLRRS